MREGLSIMLHRKKKWQRVLERTAAKAVSSPAVKRTGVGAVAGLTALTAASAAVSSARRKGHGS